MGKLIKNDRRRQKTPDNVGVKLYGRRYGWFTRKAKGVVIKTLFDDDIPVVQKKYLGTELISTTYFKKVKKCLDN